MNVEDMPEWLATRDLHRNGSQAFASASSRMTVVTFLGELLDNVPAALFILAAADGVSS